MNGFDEIYDIRFARYDEIDEIMAFIKEHWKKDHILGNNREFFEYEHVIDNRVNFIIAKKWDTSKIEGILGYIPASKDKSKLDVWGVMWKVCTGATPMLGIELKRRLKKYTEARNDLGVGANPNTSVPILKMVFRYKVKKMKHYYRLSNKDEYLIAQVTHKNIVNYQIDNTTKIIEYKSIAEVENTYDFTMNENDIPFKDSWYINHRYFEHPIYQYHVCGVYGENKVEALLVYRKQEYKQAVAIRVVDYVGNHKCFSGLGVFFGELLKTAEYIDFYCGGFEDSYVIQAGFCERTDEDSNIIPDHFSPFENRNIDIFVNSPYDNCLFFKADGDQDRPSE